MRKFPASLLVAPAAVVVLFGSTLLGIDRLAFRDVSLFYTPLYEYVAARQSSDWIPLWNPLDHTGIPLAGETTTAVFYPLRWIVYALPLSADQAIALYVAVHLLLASLTAWIAARWSGVSKVGSSIAATAYCLSGSILFLYTNPPFLAGAAWLPLALGALICRDGPSLGKRISISACSLAMMVFAGDPQTALHVMIMAALIWVVRRSLGMQVPITLRGLLLSPAIAVVLSLPQIAASVDWSRQSDRIDSDSTESWFAPPVVGSKRHQAYQYSFPPWHTIELASPNPYGTLFPINRRISRMMPGDGRMWTPSIYMGMLIASALVLSLGKRRLAGIDAWMGLALLSLGLSMGHFGLVWLIQSTTGTLGTTDSAVGGPYWLAHQLIPGYDSFRYPAKWLPLFALGASITSAKWLDDDESLDSLRRFAFFTCVALIIASIATWTATTSLSLLPNARPSGISRDEFWGPLEIQASLSQITRSLLHSSIILGFVAFLLRLRRTGRLTSVGLRRAFLATLVLELSFAASGWMLRIPVRDEMSLMEQAGQVPDAADSFWMRTQSGDGWPAVWSQTSNLDRALEVEASERLALFGRWHLQRDAAMLNSMVSIKSRDMANFWNATRDLTRTMSPERQLSFWNAIRQWLGVDAVVHSSDRAKRVTDAGSRYIVVDQSVSTRRVREPGLRTYSNWQLMRDPISSRTSMKRRLQEIAANDAEGNDPEGSAPWVLGTELAPIPDSKRLAEGILPAAKIETLMSGSETAVYRVRLDAPMLLRRDSYQDGNWRASYRPQSDGARQGEWQSTTVHKVDFLTQGVILPAGDWRLRFEYEPWWLLPCSGIALLGWLAVAATTFQYRND